jgi:hypothetical protein
MANAGPNPLKKMSPIHPTMAKEKATGIPLKDSTRKSVMDSSAISIGDMFKSPCLQ